MKTKLHVICEKNRMPLLRSGKVPTGGVLSGRVSQDELDDIRRECVSFESLKEANEFRRAFEKDFYHIQIVRLLKEEEPYEPEYPEPEEVTLRMVFEEIKRVNRHLDEALAEFRAPPAMASPSLTGYDLPLERLK